MKIKYYILFLFLILNTQILSNNTLSNILQKKQKPHTIKSCLYHKAIYKVLLFKNITQSVIEKQCPELLENLSLLQRFSAHFVENASLLI